MNLISFFLTLLACFVLYIKLRVVLGYPIIFIFILSAIRKEHLLLVPVKALRSVTELDLIRSQGNIYLLESQAPGCPTCM